MQHRRNVGSSAVTENLDFGVGLIQKNTAFSDVAVKYKTSRPSQSVEMTMSSGRPYGVSNTSSAARSPVEIDGSAVVILLPSAPVIGSQVAVPILGDVGSNPISHFRHKNSLKGQKFDQRELTYLSKLPVFDSSM